MTQWRLWNHLFLTLAVCSGLIAVGAVLLLQQPQRDWARNSRQNMLAHLVEPLAQTLSRADVDPRQHFEDWARIISRHPDVVRIAVLDRDDRPLAAYPPGPFEQGLAEVRGLAGALELVRCPLPEVAGSSLATLAFTLLVPATALGPPPPQTSYWPILLMGAAAIGLATWWLRCRLEKPITRYLHKANRLLGVQSSPAADGHVGAEFEKLLAHIDHLRREVLDWQGQSSELQRRVNLKVRAEREHFNALLRRVETQACEDALTGLENRRGMDDLLKGLFLLHRRSNLELTVVMLDIDHFKALNDTLGHQAGDGLLRFLGELVRATIHDPDLAIRYGGDEILLVLPGTGCAPAARTAAHLNSMLERYGSSLGVDPPPTLSAGIASLMYSRSITMDQLINAADQALYLAKRNGKNRVQICDSAVPEAALEPAAVPPSVQD